jgi:hypothetical protein
LSRKISIRQKIENAQNAPNLDPQTRVKHIGVLYVLVTHMDQLALQLSSLAAKKTHIIANRLAKPSASVVATSSILQA